MNTTTIFLLCHFIVDLSYSKVKRQAVWVKSKSPITIHHGIIKEVLENFKVTIVLKAQLEFEYKILGKLG